MNDHKTFLRCLGDAEFEHHVKSANICFDDATM